MEDIIESGKYDKVSFAIVSRMVGSKPNAIVKGAKEIAQFCTTMRDNNQCTQCGYHRTLTTKMDFSASSTSYQCGLGIPADWDLELNE